MPHTSSLTLRVSVKCAILIRELSLWHCKTSLPSSFCRSLSVSGSSFWTSRETERERQKDEDRSVEFRTAVCHITRATRFALTVVRLARIPHSARPGVAGTLGTGDRRSSGYTARTATLWGSSRSAHVGRFRRGFVSSVNSWAVGRIARCGSVRDEAREGRDPAISYPPLHVAFSQIEA